VVKFRLMFACLVLIPISAELWAENTMMMTEQTLDAASEQSQNSSLSDFEAQVRRVAEETAAAAKAERERKRQEAAEAAKKKPARQMTFFKYRKDGAVAYSDRAPRKTDYQVIVYSRCYACSALSTVNWGSTSLYVTQFNNTIQRASQRYGVDQALIRAVIHAESNFNPLARSRKGAMGLMQLMPGTAKDMGVRNTADATQNIQGGVKYLAYLLQRFEGNETLAVAAYNAGPGAVEKYQGVPPYKETSTYVSRVDILYQRYKKQASLASN
jgi:soluble lytic murein transglycosylase-like protein